MRCLLLVLAVLVACCDRVVAQAGAPQNDETLTYSVNWPSGLALGEVRVQANKKETTDGSAARWDLRFTLDAAAPGLQVAGRYRSLATPEFCSMEFEKDLTYGKRITRELTVFNPQAGSATRQTLGGGGKSEMPISSCAKDALAFLYYLRQEMSLGRVPAPQTVFFGGAYQVRFEYGGRQKLRIGDEPIEADRVLASVKGKASDITLEVFISQDRARRPVLVRVPLPLGVLSVELVP
jgi:hypothetical protein